MNVKNSSFAVIVACIVLALFTAILAVWGAVASGTVWRAVTTFALIGGAAFLFVGLHDWFYPPPKP